VRLIRLFAGAVALVTSASAQSEISFLTADGAEIFADLYGAGPRAAVLIHGGRFDRRSWTEQANYFAKRGFCMLAIDLRGEGKSHGQKARARMTKEATVTYSVLFSICELQARGRLM
jgi:alpha-beta hydrolase superfamily lysophospholipase